MRDRRRRWRKRATAIDQTLVLDVLVVHRGPFALSRFSANFLAAIVAGAPDADFALDQARHAVDKLCVSAMASSPFGSLALELRTT